MTGARSRPGGGATRLAARWSDERELAHAIHGTVVGAAIMVTAGLHGVLWQVVVAVVTTLLVYWATERYSELLAAGARGRVVDRRQVAAALGRGWPMLQASYAPLVVLLGASALGADLPGAVLASLVLSTVLLGGLGHQAARRAGATRVGALVWSGASALIGVAVIVMKLALH